MKSVFVKILLTILCLFVTFCLDLLFLSGDMILDGIASIIIFISLIYFLVKIWTKKFEFSPPKNLIIKGLKKESQDAERAESSEIKIGEPKKEISPVTPDLLPKKRRKWPLITAGIFLLAILSCFLFLEITYATANNCLATLKYEDAINYVRILPIQYRDSDKLELYARAKLDLKNNRFMDATYAFEDLGDYKDSAEMIKECAYQKGMYLVSMSNFKEARNVFSGLGTYKDSAVLSYILKVNQNY